MIRRALVLLLLLSAAGPAGAAEPPCDPNQPDCSCGKIPICVISGDNHGYYSSLWFEAPDGQWKGFGGEFDTFLAAMRAEIAVAQGLQQSVPCSEPILMDSYQSATFFAMEEAKDQGLEAEQQIQEVFERFDVGNYPWQDPELAKAQLDSRVLACSMAQIQLRARTKDGMVVMDAKVSSPILGAEVSKIRVEAASAAEAAAKVAADAAQPLETALAKVFSQVAAVRASEAPEDGEDRQVLDEVWCPGTWTLRAGDLDCDGQANAQDPEPWPPGDGPADE